MNMSLFGSIIVSNCVVALTVMLCCIGPANAQTTGLDTKVTFSGAHITVGKAMSEIEARSEYIFAFNPDQLDTGMPVRLSQRELTIKQALECMFGNGNFKYVVRKRFIAVSPEQPHARRANVVAHAQDTDSLSYNTYTPTDPNRIQNDPGKRLDVFLSEDPYEIERIITYVPAEPIVRNYPESYSDYQPVGDHVLFQNNLPNWAVKTNLIHAGVFLAPNVAVEIGTALRQSVEISGSYSWQGRKKTASERHKQSAHWIIRPEYRWWACERQNGHVFGTHLLFSRYYISGCTIPLLFKKEYSYDGWAAGAGVNYGYHLAIDKRWGVEFNIGVGYVFMQYDQGSCVKCDPQPVSKKHHYIGPTRAGINLVYLIK